MTPRPQPDTRQAYPRFVPLTTRWMDNDVYSLFDTAVNSLLIEADALDIHGGAVIGLVVETHCNFFESLAFPQRVEAGVRVAQQGRSSVRYEIGLFADGAQTCAARGHFVHVYVDRESRRPVAELPAAYLQALKALTP
jgi:acyl-CoA thioester hydrolase